MDENNKNDQLNDLADRLFGKLLRNRTILEMNSPPFSTAKPNIHESKSEFLIEYKLVCAIVEHSAGILELLLGEKAQSTPGQKETVVRLIDAFQTTSHASLSENPVDSPRALAIRNVVQTGFYYNSLSVIDEFYFAAQKRKEELERQQEEYWNVSHRPPNYYARTIALRFAQLYVQERRELPTFGISSYGTHPSTEFGRALERIFEILHISASVKTAATWAINHLTAKDFEPKSMRDGARGDKY